MPPPESRRSDARPSALTDEQLIAAGSPQGRLFIDAGPGTGKTTVAAQRFGAQRFDPSRREDTRAVVAVSFTRAATGNLKRRVRRVWGPTAVTWPHRIVTLDTLLYELLTDVLQAELIVWPGGHKDLVVEDSWNVFGETFSTRASYVLGLQGAVVVARRVYETGFRQRADPGRIIAKLGQGTCTHEDVRTILELALGSPTVADLVRAKLSAKMRSLIVDEIFDANELDLAIVQLALDAGVDVTLVGDPWQAVFVFRGARPEDIPRLVKNAGMSCRALTKSFRWRTDTQRDLAIALRTGSSVTLPSDKPEGPDGPMDVGIALTWKQLWQSSAHVLPLAFHSFKGGLEEAAATLLLNHVTTSVLSETATYLGDSLTSLAITDWEVVRELEPAFQEVLEVIRGGGRGSLRTAYDLLVAAIAQVSPRELRPAHAAHTSRLTLIANVVKSPKRPSLGLSAHQAKGREWDVVGVRLTDSERARLAKGLEIGNETDRKLYVATTRARRLTVEF